MTPLHEQIPIPPIVSLRRYGDIVCLLPLLKFLSEKQDAPMKLVVHRAFESILDGVSYVERIVWDGDMDDPLPARDKYKGVNAQVHGKGLNPNRSQGDYAKCAWNQLGYKWNRHQALVFDNRDLKREKLLAKETFTTDLPKILVKLNSFSSPFPDSEKVKDKLKNEFESLAEIVDLDVVNGDRIYDLLGLLDHAACLLSSDTITLWLAKATKCPVIALVNPMPFLASPPSGNVIFRAIYSQALPLWDKIATAIHSTLFDPGDDGVALVFNEYVPGDKDTKQRENQARETWSLLKARMVPFQPIRRSSKNLGDNRGTPFIKDMIEAAISSGPEKIIAICNNDVLFDAGLRREVDQSCAEFGCYWAYRLDKPGGVTDRGADFFAFTRKWWFEHKNYVPDILLGHPWWDNIALRICRWSGCLERKRLYYHVPHPGVMTRPKTPGWIHNETLAHRWLKEHHELMGQPI